MTEQPRIGAPCAACRTTTAHERIESVSYGQVFWRCLGCGTVFHAPKQQEARP